MTVPFGVVYGMHVLLFLGAFLLWVWDTDDFNKRGVFVAVLLAVCWPVYIGVLIVYVLFLVGEFFFIVYEVLRKLCD